ncbi:MAG: ATP-binding protein [Candidatus Delongbacteria bacterium]|nr:ATP-binding protein [Candidatus Delongbacteria bacterium]
MIERNIETTLYKELEKDTILTLIGARQVGKTTLLYKIRDHLKDKEENVEYFTLEDRYLLSDLNEHPKNIFNYISSKPEKKIYLLIDEIQYLDDPSNFLKYIYDLHKDIIKLIVTGSSAFYIDKKFTDSLAGRKKIIRVTPFSFSEFLRAKDENNLSEIISSYSIMDESSIPVRNKKLLKPHKDKIALYYREYFKYGGYPKVVLESDENIKAEMLKELYTSFLKKDILESGIKNELKFYDLLRILAAQCGELLNMNELSNTLNISRDAVENYIYVMEKGFIIKLIRSYHTNLRKEISKMPKVYFLDTGYRNTILNNYNEIDLRIDNGQSLENSFFINMNILNNFNGIKFWRTQNKNEVDFLINEQTAFEIKFNRNKFNLSKYKVFNKNYPDIPLYCISYSKNYSKETELVIYDFLK